MANGKNKSNFTPQWFGRGVSMYPTSLEYLEAIKDPFFAGERAMSEEEYQTAHDQLNSLISVNDLNELISKAKNEMYPKMVTEYDWIGGETGRKTQKYQHRPKFVKTTGSEKGKAITISDNLIKEMIEPKDQTETMLGLEEGPLGGLINPNTWKPASYDTAKVLEDVLSGRSPYSWETGEMEEYDIKNIVKNIDMAKEYWEKNPRRASGGGSSIFPPPPEKMKGIMALLQRLLPGGKTGYR